MNARNLLRRPSRIALIPCAFSILLLTPTWLRAEEDPCAFEGTFQDLLNEVPDTPAQEAQAATAVDAESLKAELLSRANGDGLAPGRVDLIRRAFVALGLGNVTEENKDLVFNFNPDFLGFSAGQLSPRVVLHEKSLYGALTEKIDTFPEGTRADRNSALEGQLGDLDDVELKLRWTNSRAGTRAALQPIVNELFEKAYEDAAGEVSDDELGNLSNQVSQAVRTAFPGEDAKRMSVAKICTSPEAKAVLVKNVAEIRTRVARDIETLRTALTDNRFFALADLIEGQPKFILDGSFRRRVGPAGPNEGTLNVTWQMSPISYNGAQKWAKGKLTAAKAQQYLKEKGRLEDALPLFSLSAQYTRTNDFRVAIPNEIEEFLAPGGHVFTGKVTAGAYFGGGKDRRLDFEATYDDVSDDPMKKDRFVAKLSWTEKLNAELAKLAGGSDFVATLIYANKPEFRGEVDEDFGVRAGLKWSLGGN